MLTTRDVRTTISMPDDLLFELKKKALLGRKALKDVIIEGLRLYLYTGSKNTTRGLHEEFDIMSLYGTWGKGRSGKSSVEKMRHGRSENKREEYLRKEWKKS